MHRVLEDRDTEPSGAQVGPNCNGDRHGRREEPSGDCGGGSARWASEVSSEREAAEETNGQAVIAYMALITLAGIVGLGLAMWGFFGQ